MEVHPVSYHVSLSFAAPVCELFTRWIHEMNPLGLGNIPFHAPIHLCNAWAVSSFTLSPSISCFIPVTLTGRIAFIYYTNISLVLQWIEFKIGKHFFEVTIDKMQFSNILEGPRLTVGPDWGGGTFTLDFDPQWTEFISRSPSLTVRTHQLPFSPLQQKPAEGV